MDIASLSSTQEARPAPRGKSQEMGSEGFMKLLMTQLQHQDPTKPTENSELVAQFANMSMVSGMSEMKSTVTKVGSQLKDTQALYASNLAGKQAVILANHVQLTKKDQVVEGKVLLNANTDKLTVNVYDGSNKLVAELPLGKQDKGPIEFNLKDLKKPLPAGEYRLEAQAMINGKKAQLPIAQRSTIKSVIIDGPNKQIIVEAAGIGLVQLEQIQEYLPQTVAANNNQNHRRAFGGNKDKSESKPEQATKTKEQYMVPNPFFNHTNALKTTNFPSHLPTALTSNYRFGG